MAIQFRIDRATVGYDLPAQEWVGDQRLVNIMERYPRRPQRATPVSRAIQPDDGNEVWVYLHGYWALINAGEVFTVDARPVIREHIPPGAVA